MYNTDMVESGYVNRIQSTVTSGQGAQEMARYSSPEPFSSNIAKNYVENKIESVKHFISPGQHYKPPEDIDFALLSQKAYGRSTQDRQTEGFNILQEHSAPDRVVYQHQRTGHVVIAFRGTDLHDKSRRNRDIGADALLATGYQSMSHRFYNAEKVTQDLINKYGKENVTATGHSLGGSQALYVSRKFNIHAEAYNPHITWQDAVTHANYYHANVHVNMTDPVAALYPYINAENKDIRYNRKKAPFLAQHGISNFVRKTPAQPQKLPVAPTIPKSNEPPKRIPVRPVVANPAVQNQYTHYAGGQDLTSRTMDCSHMSHYQQVIHGCPRRARASA